MNASRIVSLAAAAVISAIQVAVLSSPLSPAQAVRAVPAVAIARGAPDGGLPVIVVTAHRTRGA